MAPLINQPTEPKELQMQEYLLGDDQRQFSRLYDHYSGALFGLILKWVSDMEAAENLLQDVFLKAWRSRGLYDAEKGKLFTWLYNITRNICIDHLRSKAYKKARLSVLSDNMAGIVSTGNDCLLPETIGIRKLVDNLRDEEREVIELMYFKGFTQKEIATMMDTPLGTVKTRMSRAIKNLRYYFKKDWKDATRTISLN